MALRSNKAVELILDAKDKITGVIDRVDKSLGRLKLSAAAAGAAITSALAGIGLSRLFGSAIESASEFEQSLAKVAAVTKASAAEMDALRKAAEEAGATTKFTATEAAQGLEILARSGLSAADAIQTLPQVLTLATAEGLELAESAGFITTSIKQFGLEATEATRVIDVLVKTSQSANTDVREIGNAFSYAALLAKDAGLSIEQTAAIIGRLADAGIRSERAGTALRGILSQLADPASKARRELAALGDTSGDLTTALDTIRSAGDRGNKALLAFGTEAAPALRTLVNTGVPAINQLVTALLSAAGSADQAATTMGATLNGALTRLNSAWDALKRTVVQPLLGPIADQADRLAKSIGDFVSSGRLGQFQQALVSAFNSASTAADNFFKSFDFDKFIADLSRFTTNAVDSFGKLASAASAAANVLSLAYNGLQSVLAGARIAIGQIRGDTEAVDQAFRDLEASTVNSRKALESLGIVAKSHSEIIEVISRETYDAADANERLNSTTIRAAATLKEIQPVAKGAGDAIGEMGDKAGQAGQGMDELGTQTETTAATVEKSIGTLSAAFDGSLESIQSVTEQLQKQREAAADAASDNRRLADSQQAAGESTEDAADATEKTTRSLVAQRPELNAGADAWRDYAETIRQSNAGVKALGGSVSNAAIAEGELATAVAQALDRLQRQAGATGDAAISMEELARQTGIGIDQLRRLDAQSLDQLRSALTDAAQSAEDTAERIAELNRQFDELDAREARAQGDDSRAKLLEQELAFQQELAEIEAQIEQARLFGLTEELNRLEKIRQRLLEIQRLERERLEAEENARRERERESGQSSTTPRGSGAQPAAFSQGGITFNLNSTVTDPRTFDDFARQIEKKLKQLGVLRA